MHSVSRRGGDGLNACAAAAAAAAATARLIPSRYQDWAAGYKSPERTNERRNDGDRSGSAAFFET